MSNLPAQQDGHLVVAAIRILEAREEHPPHEGEIAGILAWGQERVAFVCRGLIEAGILSRVTGAYDNRYRIENHLALEELPAEDEGEVGIASDLAAFDEKSKQEQEKLEQLFARGEEPNKKKRLEELDNEFGKFKQGKPLNPFGDD